MRRGQAKILLLQMRKSPETLLAERQNFIQHSGLTEQQLISLDVYRCPDFDPSMILDFDGFFVGGLSDDPSDELRIDNVLFPFIRSLYDLLDLAEKKLIPGLLSCGGFMLASKYWGADITLDRRYREMGVYDLFFDSTSTDDILFEHLPPKIKIVSGHLKSTATIPPNCKLLASTRLCPIHVLRLKKAPIYAFQGHPEITTTDLMARVTPYKSKYFNSEKDFLAFLHLDEDTEPVNNLLARFVNLIEENKFAVH